MSVQSFSTPIRPCFPINSTLQKSLEISKKRKELRHCVWWGSVNILILSLIIYDLTHTCPFYKSTVHYVEYVAAIILSINTTYLVIRYVYVYLTLETLPVTPRQKKLLGVKDSDPSYSVTNKPLLYSPMNVNATPNYHYSVTPLNTTALSWMSPNENPDYKITNSATPLRYLKSTTSGNASPAFSVTPINTTALSWRSQGESPNLSSASWHYNQGSPLNQSHLNQSNFNPSNFNQSNFNHSSFNQSPVTPPKPKPKDTSGIDQITDESALSKYLEDYEKNEKEVSIKSPSSPEQSSWLSSFWNYPLMKNPLEVPSFLRRAEYQLSQQPPAASTSPKADEQGSPLNQNFKGMETWKKLHVDSISLTQWNENLRKWISQTILDRLVNEIDSIDQSLQLHQLDLKIGQVGLDRLRKTAQMAPVIQYLPTLFALLPFLELTPNQEYLVKRIRELSRGGCMSDFKWNGGSSFHGKDWEPSLPTDSAIIMHVFASYMDTQLMPSPNQPDAKPFSTFHYIRVPDKFPELTQNTMAIQEACLNPPHYRVVVGSEVFELVKGYNNLFHSILLFLYHVNQRDHGMLGRVNLGKAGINMLWIINS